MKMKTERGGRALIAAVLAAGIVHAIAAGYVAAVDPIAALLGPDAPGVIVALAAVALAAARIFLIVVAPACAACALARAIGRAVYRSK